jgi:hypothetical protein
MVRKLTSVAVGIAAAWVLLPAAAVWAGGPPILCLPLEGVQAGNVERCTELLNERLAGKFFEHGSLPRGVKLSERSGQWYLAFYMGSDVRLSDVTSALEGSGASVPLDKLRFFGHVILEIDAPAKSRPALLTDLSALSSASVAGSKSDKDRLLVTLDMPYPVESGRSDLDSVGWVSFQRNDFASNPAKRAESPATAEKLPGHRAISDVIKKHHASLTGIRWSTDFACRALGCVAVK